MSTFFKCKVAIYYHNNIFKICRNSPDFTKIKDYKVKLI